MQALFLLTPLLVLVFIWIVTSVFPAIGDGIRVLFRRARQFTGFNTFLVKTRNKKILKVRSGNKTVYCIRKGWIWYRYMNEYRDHYSRATYKWKKRKYTYDTVQKVGEIWDDVVLNNKEKESEIFIEKVR